MKITTYAQHQAQFAKMTKHLQKSIIDNNGNFVMTVELKALIAPLAECSDAYVDQLKSTHDNAKLEFKAKSLATPNVAKIAKSLVEKPHSKEPTLQIKTETKMKLSAKELLSIGLQTKSVILDSADGSALAVAELITGSIVEKSKKANGLLNQLTIVPTGSVDTYILRELTDAQVKMYQESDGQLGFTNADTINGNIAKTPLILSDVYHKLPVTDEALNDAPSLVDFTLGAIQTAYEDQFGSELVMGDSSSGELPGIFTDLIDFDNAYAEAYKSDATRDINTLAVHPTSASASIGTSITALDTFNTVVSELPALHRVDAVVTMHPSTLLEYQKLRDSTNQLMFDITPTTFQKFRLELDENYPIVTDTNKAVVTVGRADRALELVNLDLKIQPNPFQRDGVTVFKHVGRVGLAVKDNNALRVIVATIQPSV